MSIYMIRSELKALSEENEKSLKGSNEDGLHNNKRVIRMSPSSSRFSCAIHVGANDVTCLLLQNDFGSGGREREREDISRVARD